MILSIRNCIDVISEFIHYYIGQRILKTHLSLSLSFLLSVLEYEAA